MTITTQRCLIRKVADRWRAQYEPFQPGRMRFSWRTRKSTAGPDTREVYERLVALDKETATPEDVAAIIGNDSWTRLTCSECHKDVTAVVTFSSWNGDFTEVCVDCVRRAFNLSKPFRMVHRRPKPLRPETKKILDELIREIQQTKQ